VANRYLLLSKSFVMIALLFLELLKKISAAGKNDERVNFLKGLLS